MNSAIAGSAIAIAFMGMAAPPGRRASGIAIGLGLSVLSSLALSIFGLCQKAFLSDWSAANVLASTCLAFAVFIAIAIWSIGALAAAFRNLAPDGSIRPIRRAIGATLGTLAALALLPSWPVFVGSDFTRTSANLWEIASAYQEARREPDPERASDEDGWAAIELAQSALLDAALEGLRPRVASDRNIFALGIAGWSSQDVFMSEVTGALAVLAERFDTAERSIRLANNPQTVSQVPLATLSNLTGALRGIAKQMDRENDALVLFVTSHGDSTGIALEFGSLVRRVMSPRTLKTILDETGIKNRIVIVSACYSGVFVPELANENTVVITASSATTNSFGCSNERDWTYFGDAFFNQALRTEPTLAAAYDKAKDLVSEWERRDGLKPSQPQIHVGEAIGRLFPVVGKPSVLPTSTTAATSE